MPFVAEHLDAFTRTIDHERSQGPVGMSPMAWAASVNYQAPAGTLSKDKFCRNQVRAYCQSADHTPENCFVTIMAWGGSALRLPYRQQAWAARDRWINTVSFLRNEELDRADAYDNLMALKINGDLPGLGPAFFTKLIFFMLPDRRGYIMDQWLGKSINLLVGKPVVKMDGECVSLRNTSANYENFCAEVDCLATQLQLSPEATEHALFSKGGHYPEPWRLYVREHYGQHL